MKVFYDKRMVAETTSYSPSAAKPKKLAERIQKLGIEVEFCGVEPMEWKDFYLSHDPKYVDGVRNLKEANGFGNRDRSVRDSLPYTTGALFCAAKAALKEGVAWAFCSGFHHATRKNGSGFCTFEGLTVSAKKLLNLSLIKKALILDGDYHYGNGCVDCITEEWMEKIGYWHTGGRWYAKEKIAGQISKHSPDIIFFQDGMDAYKYDPIGGGLTYKQLYERNKNVCSVAKEAKLPLVINLAGGYLRFPEGEEELEPVLLGHINGLLASMEIFEPGRSMGAAKVMTSPQPWEKP